MSKSYLLILCLLSAPLFAMEKIDNKKYAENMFKEASSKVKNVSHMKDKKESKKAWFDLLIDLGKLEACKDLGFFESDQVISDIEKSKEAIQRAFLLYLSSEKRAGFLKPMIKLGEEGVFGEENKDAFRDLSAKLEEKLEETEK